MTADAFVYGDMASAPRKAPLLAAFTVEGVPEPKGSISVHINKKTGRPQVVHGGRRHKRKDGSYSNAPQRYRRWCTAVTAAARVYQIVNRRIPRKDESLFVEIAFYLPKPPSLGRRVTLPNRAPDVDKLARLVNDCLVTAGVISDDARIVDLYVRKRFAIGKPPRAEIFIRQAGSQEGEPLPLGR